MDIWGKKETIPELKIPDFVYIKTMILIQCDPEMALKSFHFEMIYILHYLI